MSIYVVAFVTTLRHMASLRSARLAIDGPANLDFLILLLFTFIDI
jgi:hypothetical protein